MMEREINKILNDAKRSIQIEIETLQNLHEGLDENISIVVNLILKCKGRVVITGIGKSAIIAQKIAASFNSTGTPALFLHAADAIHGDLGMIESKDVVIILSKSGNTPEIKVLARMIKEFGNPLVALHSNTTSYLAKHADQGIHIPVLKEADPNNLAPTASTIAQLAIGDAITVALINARGFTKDHFARFHPGGSLGRELFLKVENVLGEKAKAQVGPEAGLNEVIIEISSKRQGATAVVKEGSVLGIITDGDLRRMLQKGKDLIDIKAVDIMSKGPKSISSEDLLVNALSLLRQNNITQLIVKKNEQYIGIIHLHDILKEGIN